MTWEEYLKTEVKDRITTPVVDKLGSNEVFVFGSNESGRHGKGAAKTAMKWGAEYGNPEGPQGKCYAIPTKNKSITKTLHNDKIEAYVDRFIDYARFEPGKTFLVTKIGCGLAGLPCNVVANMFIDASEYNNIKLPIEFWYEIYKIQFNNKK